MYSQKKNIWIKISNNVTIFELSGISSVFLLWIATLFEVQLHNWTVDASLPPLLHCHCYATTVSQFYSNLYKVIPLLTVMMKTRNCVNSLVYVGQEKIVSESSFLTFIHPLWAEECRRLCSKTLFMRTTKPKTHFEGKRSRCTGPEIAVVLKQSNI